MRYRSPLAKLGEGLLVLAVLSVVTGSLIAEGWVDRHDDIVFVAVEDGLTSEFQRGKQKLDLPDLFVSQLAPILRLSSVHGVSVSDFSDPSSAEHGSQRSRAPPRS